MRIKKKLAITISVLVFTLAASPAYAQNAPSDADEWEFQITPYVWAPESEIDSSTVNGRSVQGELDFDDFIDLVDFAGFVHVEAWKKDWGLVFDAMHLDFGADGTIQVPAGTVNLDLDYRHTVLELAVSRRSDFLPIGSIFEKEDTPALWGELMAGGRYSYLKQEIDLTGIGPQIGEASGTLGGSEDWVEPFIGTRIGLFLTERLKLGIKADIGGFGIGSASDRTWNFYAGFDYRYLKWLSVKAGYRIYDVKYEKGSGGNRFGYDGQLRGPWIGATFYF